MVKFDFARPFTFVFEDLDWVKKLLMAFLYMLGMIFCYAGLIAIFGYQKRLIATVAEGRDVPLPEFDIGRDFVEGLKVLVIVLAYYALPIGIYLCGGLGATFLGEAAGEEEIGAIGTMCAALVAMPLFVAAQFLLPVGLIRLVETESIGAAFSPREIIDIVRNHFVDLLLAYVVRLAVGMLAGFGIILFCVGIYATLAWAKLVEANAYGQVLRLVRQRRAAAG